MGITKKNLSQCSIWGVYLLIFVCVGSREYQFNRLLIKLDNLIEKEIIKEEVVAQIGESDYIPKQYKYFRYIPQDQFEQYIEKSRIVISHGGTGSIILALKKDKNVIGVTRLRKYGEHINDHQVQFVEELSNEKYIYGVKEMDELEIAITYFNKDNNKLKKFDKKSNILEIIDDFIQKNTI